MVLNQDGIFSRAEQATDKYGQSKARETLELALGEAQMQKYEQGLTDEQLDNKINEIGELLPKEDPNSNNQQVIVDGSIFEIDRSVPKIIDYIGPADGVVITAQVSQNGNWQNPVATVKGTITKYGGGTVVSSSATATNGVTISGFPTAGGSYTIPNITEDTDITITASADDGKPAVSKTIQVRLVRDTTGPVITSFEASAEGLNIIINARAEDRESGMQSLTYNITSLEDTTLEGIPADKRTGSLEQGKTITIETTPTGNRDITTYKITVTARDNANNSTTSPEKEAKTEEVVFKNIKTPEGLKKVKARDIYGADVKGYTCDRTEVEWQIFYIDEEDDHRVYLIAKDYMAPPTTETELTRGSTNYTSTYYWNTAILNKYKTTIPTSNTTTELGKFMGKFLSDYAGVNASSQENLQATNYMLDQTVWDEYMSKDNKSDLVFGGPTLPLFVGSLNDIKNTTSKINISKDITGYNAKFGTTTLEENNVIYVGCNEQTQSGIYFKSTINGGSAYGLYLASPCRGARNSNGTYITNWMMRATLRSDGIGAGPVGEDNNRLPPNRFSKNQRHIHSKCRWLIYNKLIYLILAFL